MLIPSLFYKMKNIFLLVFITNLYSNAYFEIIDAPKNIYSLSSNSVFLNHEIKTINKYNFSTSFFQYPAGINLLHISKNNNFTFSILDYGKLHNQIDNENLNTFNAYELLVNYTFFINSNNYTWKIKPNIVHSQIKEFSSTALFSDLEFISNYSQSNISFKSSINNIGFIIDNYTLGDNYLPLKYSFEFSKYFLKEKLYLGFNASYYDAFEKDYYVLSINKKINDRVNLLLNLSSIRKTLNDGNIFNSIIAGFSGGIIISNEFYNLGLGISSLGDAGYIYCVSFDFK